MLYSVLVLCLTALLCFVRMEAFDQGLLTELLITLGMPAESTTLPAMNTWAQAHLLRQGERWEIQKDNYEPLRSQIQPILEKMGFYAEAHPQNRVYTAAIVHGGMSSRMSKRLDYLIEQWKRGVRFDRIYFLTSERPLQQWEKCAEASKEWELQRLLWEQKMPAEMQHIPVVYIHPPMQFIKGTSLRPTTDHAIKAWLATEPLCGDYLAISNAPIRLRQDLVIQQLLPIGFTCETAGPASPTNESLALVLDELARYLYLLSTDQDENP